MQQVRIFTAALATKPVAAKLPSQRAKRATPKALSPCLSQYLQTEHCAKLMSYADPEPGEAAVDVDSSSDNSDHDVDNDWFEKRLAQRSELQGKLLKRRGKARVRKAVITMADLHAKVGRILGGDVPPYLLLSSVKGNSLQMYLNGLDECFGSLTTSLTESSAKVIDRTLVDWMHREFLKGYGPWKGENTIAALGCLLPEFGQHGVMRIPCALQCLRGWRRLIPHRSKKPIVWATWCAIALTMCRLGFRRAGICTLLMVALYLRVREMLGLQVKHLQRPTSQGLLHFTIILFPSEGHTVSKTGTQDESVALDNPLMELVRPVLQEWSTHPGDESLANMGYVEHYALFRRVCTLLGLIAVPSQARHSGASLDRASGRKTPAEVQRQGRWQSKKSTRRYEQAGMLNAAWMALSESQRRYFQVCEEVIGDAVLRQRFPSAHTFPLNGKRSSNLPTKRSCSAADDTDSAPFKKRST